MEHPSIARVGVVVVTHASAKEVAATLGALETTALARVVVVDNASPDDTVAVVHGLALANVEVVEQANVGFGAGNDAGRAHLPDSAEFALFLNPDCVISPTDLEALVAYLDAHQGCALVGPRLETEGGAARTPGGDLPTLLSEMQPHLPRVVGRFVARRQLDAVTSSRNVGYVEGACMLVRLAAYDAVGGFDTRYFLCFEEIDLARRLRERGWDVAVCADAVAVHAGQRSRARVPLFSTYHQYRSQRLYLERWCSPAAARLYARLATTSWWLRLRAGRIDAAQYRVLRAAVSGADFPS